MLLSRGRGAPVSLDTAPKSCAASVSRRSSACGGAACTARAPPPPPPTAPSPRRRPGAAPCPARAAPQPPRAAARPPPPWPREPPPPPRCQPGSPPGRRRGPPSQGRTAARPSPAESAARDSLHAPSSSVGLRGTRGGGGASGGRARCRQLACKHGELRHVAESAQTLAAKGAVEVAREDLGALIEKDLAAGVHRLVAEAWHVGGEQAHQLHRGPARRAHQRRRAAAVARHQRGARLAQQPRPLRRQRQRPAPAHQPLHSLLGDGRQRGGGDAGGVPQHGALHAAREVGVLELRPAGGGGRPEAEVEGVHDEQVGARELWRVGRIT